MHLKFYSTRMGELDEHEKLVSTLKQVEVVISTLAVPQHLDQLKIISAIKEAGTIKRFVPSEYGNEANRSTSALPPFEALLSNKRKIRRAEEAGLSFTFVAGNSFAAYFVDYLLHPHHNPSQVVVYGTGEAKVVFNYEEDVAAYTIKASTDPRAVNRIIIYRLPGNIASQLELISAWEKKDWPDLEKRRQETAANLGAMRCVETRASGQKAVHFRRTSSCNDAAVSEASFMEILKKPVLRGTEAANNTCLEPSDGVLQAGHGKKKGKKGRQIDPALLGFKVTCNRIMMGEIQRLDD
ncbi:Isoeugenol synthase 1 [Hibiscus syriacus]|uniref:Isoeugenol synthase 1 n=1 Tax=Hibiscus syriacus TaxID=106335 RepID=A0A6A3AQV6_HIBSY|nr:Isoeugenol synthase 1 [Hibiscus syriacus]